MMMEQEVEHHHITVRSSKKISDLFSILAFPPSARARATAFLKENQVSWAPQRHGFDTMPVGWAVAARSPTARPAGSGSGEARLTAILVTNWPSPSCNLAVGRV